MNTNTKQIRMKETLLQLQQLKSRVEVLINPQEVYFTGKRKMRDSHVTFERMGQK